MSQDRFQSERERFTRLTQDILDNTDMVSLIEPLVEGGLRKQGQSYTGLCPFHSDTKPSLSVSPAKGVYRCWSCDAGLNGSSGGDAITFVRRYFNLPFRQACEYLGARVGISLTPEGRVTTHSSSQEGFRDVTEQAPSIPAPIPQPQADFVRRESASQNPVYETTKDEQLTVLRQAQIVYGQSFDAQREPREYLFTKRGISPQAVERFALGFAPKGFGFLESKFSYYHGNKKLLEAGLTKPTAKNNERSYDVFRGRLLFGVRDEQGQIVGFGGRLLEDESFTDKRTGKIIHAPKYLNSPESLAFEKSKLLFGEYENATFIKETSQAIIVEGYMDVVGLANYGVNNAVACMGVATSEHHIASLANKAQQIVMCFDGDTAGRQGAARSMQGALPLMSDDSQLDVRFLLLPDGLDPDDYVKAHGKEQFNRLIENSYTLIDFARIALNEIRDQALTEPNRTPAEAYERQLDRVKHWISLTPEHSKTRKELAQLATDLMNNYRQGNPLINAIRRVNATPISSSPVVDGSGESVDVRIAQAIFMHPELAQQKRQDLINTANAAPREQYDAYRSWVSWYDATLSQAIATSNDAVKGGDRGEQSLLGIVERVISATINQSQHLVEQTAHRGAVHSNG